jgi:hypothetical protein
MQTAENYLNNHAGSELLASIEIEKGSFRCSYTDNPFSCFLL